MAQKESALSRRIVKALKAEYGRDLFVFKVHGSEFMMAGLPDLIGVYRGFMFAFETKIPDNGNKTSARQDYVIALMRRAGAYVDVPRSVAEALSMFARFVATIDD